MGGFFWEKSLWNTIVFGHELHLEKSLWKLKIWVETVSQVKYTLKPAFSFWGWVTPNVHFFYMVSELDSSQFIVYPMLGPHITLSTLGWGWGVVGYIGGDEVLWSPYMISGNPHDFGIELGPRFISLSNLERAILVHYMISLVTTAFLLTRTSETSMINMAECR